VTSIYDIARVAGVSSATVSRVINGSDLVRPETAERVRSVMRELSFTPNIFAQSLQSNSMKVLAVLTVDISDIYFAVVVQSIERYARIHGYDLQVAFAQDDRDNQMARLSALGNKLVDGIILAGSTFARLDGASTAAAVRERPVVVLNGRINGPNIYSVVCDDALGMESAVDHLADQGRKNIVYMFDGWNPAAQAKMDGYSSSLKRRGLPTRTIESSPGIAAAYDACSHSEPLIGQIDAVVCAEDELAIGVIKYLTQRGLRVPEDVAVTGYDNLAFALSSTPELTSVDGQAVQISETAARVVIDVLEGREVPSTTNVAPQLVVRGSTVAQQVEAPLQE
jgi:LacI family transcriptional regulator